MIIYQMTHVPTGRIYIGSLKQASRWLGYCSSSQTVREMMALDPSAWQREILCHIEPDPAWDYARVVNLEQRLIKRAVLRLGWQGVWNKCYWLGSSRAYSPEAMAKKQKSLTGRTQSEQEKQIRSQAAFKRYLDLDERIKTGQAVSLAKLGTKLSTTHKQAISQAHQGRVKTDAHLLAIKTAREASPDITCPHCGKTGRPYGALKKWHFDNCKHKETK